MPGNTWSSVSVQRGSALLLASAVRGPDSARLEHPNLRGSHYHGVGGEGLYNPVQHEPRPAQRLARSGDRAVAEQSLPVGGYDSAAGGSTLLPRGGRSSESGLAPA